MKELSNHMQEHIQNPVKYLWWSVNSIESKLKEENIT